jgi:DNA polymerase III epsilon subunit-like protein
VDFESCVYCVFDLETTGFSRNYHDIIEICAILIDSNGVVHDKEVATFHSLVKPPAPISPLITGITGISNETVADAPSFQECGSDFIKFLKDNCKKSSTIGGVEWEVSSAEDSGDEDDDNQSISLRDIVLVAQNGNRFDIPFLFKSLQTYGVDIKGVPFKGKIDTIDLVKHAIRGNATIRVPENYRLATLYKLATGLDLEDGHRAINDANATLSILQAASFWAARKDVCKVIINIADIAANNTPTSRPPIEEDSDTEAESDVDVEDDTPEDDEEEDDEDGIIGNRWKTDTPFVAPNVKARYDDVFTRETRGNSERRLPGLKISRNSVNSPLKAWNYIFTESLFSKIVGYTNSYGQEKCSRWTDITVGDLKDFIAVLFLSSIQKRKDKPNNWWSDDPLLDFPIVKKIMSGKKFNIMLRYLHVCDMTMQPSVHSPSYSPMYKVQEMMDYLERRYKLAFEAGPTLSLDESLVRAFGRIKFKVRIITKSARYGIKIYVLADARTSYVLNVLVYTGQYTYNNNPESNEELKKTVKVCKELCMPFKGSHRVVYVDRFYTSIQLIEELEKMNLYVTGTVMGNRIPEQLRITKRSKEFREMERGDHKMHLYEYETVRGEKSKMGLVCWKDKDIVYCLTNATNTAPTGHCYRRSQTGRICISRPLAIQEYNTNMGGVDLADQRRLHCNSTIKGLHRWWLKIFFYMLDVGTSNSLVLYNEATGKSLNVASFKRELVLAMVGHKIMNIPEEPTLEHSLVRGEARLTCVYCDMFSNKNSRTRYFCANADCMLPLCHIDEGKNIRDCFALAHDNEQLRCILIQRRDKMKQKANHRPRQEA